MLYMHMKKIFTFILIGFATLTQSNLFAQCTAGSSNGNSYQLCYTSPVTGNFSLGGVTDNTYVRVAVVKGFTYRFTTCGDGFDSQITVRDDSGNYLAYDDDNGPDCSGTAASVDYAATYTGYVRVQVNTYNCTTGHSSSAVNVKVVAGSQAFHVGDRRWNKF